MRLLCLMMTAFGPYAGCQRLDFRELGERTFFLIHGPTGAGKTTILDGICFALFGDASGTQRDGKSLRSDHADRSAITEVTLDFAIGDACYQVKRIPEQERPKKRGEGTTLMTAQAELWSTSEEGRPALRAAKWLDVTKQVENLLGFKSSQFRQVVLLPQGEFRRLLTANSNERQEIMQALFKTDIYCNIEEKLKERALTLRKSSEEIIKQRQWVLQEAGIKDPEELIGLLSRNNLFLEQLIRELTHLDEGVKLAQQAVNLGLAAEEKIREKQKAEQLLAALMAEKAAIEQERIELSRATAAAQLSDAEKSVAYYAQDVSALEKNAREYKVELDLAMQQLQDAERLLMIEEGKESTREEIAGEIIRLRQFEDKIRQMEQAMEEVGRSRLALRQAVEKKDELELADSLLQEKIEQIRNEEEKALRLSLEANAREGGWHQAQGILTKSRLLTDYKKMADQQEQQVLEAEEKMGELEKNWLAAKSRFRNVQQEWLQGQAALMASSLAAGDSCPVCGSTEHPRLAVSGKTVPDERQIKKAQTELENLEAKREICRNEYSVLQVECNTWRKRVEDLQGELKEEALLPLEVLERRVETLEQQYRKASKAKQQARELAGELVKLKKEQEKRRQESVTAQEVWHKAGQLAAAAESVVKERRLVIPEQLQEKGKLAAALQRLEHTGRQYKEAWEKARQNAQLGKQAAIEKQALWENTRKRLASARVNYEKEEQLFIRRVLAAGFTDRQVYEEAKRKPERVSLIAENVAAFDHAFSKATLLAERAGQEAVDLIVPDMVHLRQVVVERQKQYNDALSRHANLEALIKQQKSWLERIKQADAGLAAVEGGYAVAGRLAEVANGGNEHKLTLQRFVLGTLLENVVIAANERLKMMSRGRYVLQRTLDRARKNAAGGLDLEVFDHYTGIARGVGTLSGGETFLASLSLALGLADVVQSYAGGIHLDTVLVDEGFGTLDPETLDFAIKALLDLQQGGRLVGIISHVPELKERIDARLEVEATERGSKASFKIG